MPTRDIEGLSSTILHTPAARTAELDPANNPTPPPRLQDGEAGSGHHNMNCNKLLSQCVYRVVFLIRTGCL